MALVSAERTSRRLQPTGCVTFLFSDIEGSTRRWETKREAMQRALRRHDRILQTSIESHNGRVFKTVGDQFCAVFWSPQEAVAAAQHAQRSLAAVDWSAVDGLSVRMALHTGVSDERNGDYFGPALNRVARLLTVGHGGQVLLSGFTADLTSEHLPSGTALRDLGTHRLKDLAQPERVYQLVAAEMQATFPSLRRLSSPRYLPAQLSSFLGREAEVAAVTELVETGRLVTITGSGGVGKTRTALQVAANIVDDLDDGAWFVDLAPVCDADLLSSAIAAVFKLEDRDGAKAPIDNVTSALSEKRLLIVLDNCEHLIGAAAHAAHRILTACPHVRILATSREALRVAGERIYRLQTLPVPKGDHITPTDAAKFAAVALFAERARSANHDFKVTDANADLVAEIVRHLDGIALAIELAAAQLGTLSLEALAEHLDEHFHVLQGGNRNALPRQQTLHALIEWSYGLLDTEERSLLRALSVFRDGWTLEAAHALFGSELSTHVVSAVLGKLVDKSMVLVDHVGDESRYRLLEPTRRFALARLHESAERSAVYALHCRYYCERSQALADEYWSVNEDRHLAAVQLDLENFRGAIAWALTEHNDIRSGALIVANLGAFWKERLFHEGQTLVGRALRELGGTDDLLRARLLVVRTHFSLDGSLGLEAATEAVRLFRLGGDRMGLADALRMLANSISRSGRPADALGCLQEALAIARKLSIPRFTVAILGWLGFCYAYLGQPKPSRAAFDEAIALAQEVGDPVRMPLTNLAELQFLEGDLTGAVSNAKAALAVQYETGTPFQLLIGRCNLAAYFAELGELTDAENHAAIALEMAVNLRRSMPAGIAMQHLAQVAARRGETERAAKLLGYVDGVYASEKHPREPTEQRGHERILTILRATYSPSRLTQLQSEGAALEPEAAVALAAPRPYAQRR